MKLSPYQKYIMTYVNKGLYVWTNEGSNLKAWLGKSDGTIMKKVRINTVEKLVKSNVLVLDEGDYPHHLFRYTAPKK